MIINILMYLQMFSYETGSFSLGFQTKPGAPGAPDTHRDIPRIYLFHRVLHVETAWFMGMIIQVLFFAYQKNHTKLSNM